MNDLGSRRTDELLLDVAVLPEVQRRNAPSSELWRRASAELAPLFEELASRQRALPSRAPRASNCAAASRS